MKMKKIALLLTITILAMSCFTGCSSVSTTTTATTAAATTTAAANTTAAATTAAATTVAEKENLLTVYSKIENKEATNKINRDSFKIDKVSQKYKIGYVAGTLGSAYFYVGPNATKTYLESLGCECLISDAKGDLATQVSQIENFITQKVDGIIINSCDPPAGVSAALQKAADAGIPVVAVDSMLDQNFNNYLAFIGSDNYNLGFSCGVYTAQYLKEKNGSVSGNACVLDGVEGNAVAKARYDGFWDGVKSVDPNNTLKEVSHLYGGSWTEEAGTKMAEDMLVANPKIDVMFGISDPFVTGALTAANRVNRNEMIMTAVDGQKAALKLLKDGTAIKCIAGQDPIGMGLIASNLILSYLENGTLPEAKILRIAPVVATSDNIDTIYNPNSEF